MSVNWALPFDERIVPENKRTLIPIESYHKVHKNTVANCRQFWAGIASELDWFKPWERILDESNPPFYKWFPGGQLNASHLCVDRHIRTWRKNKVAIIWEGEQTENGLPSQIRKLTYQDIYREVNRIAHILKEKYGIRKGDTIGFYLPMIPEFPIFMLAAARLGACFTVIFSGFSADSLAERLVDADAKLLVTADGGHDYVDDGPVIEVMTIAMYEAAVKYPEPDRWDSITDRQGVNVLYTTATAIRSFMKNGEE